MSLIAEPVLDAPQPLLYRDLRGVDLRRRRIRYCSLAGARLDDADLREATLINVGLDHASLTGTLLTGAKFLSVDASSADFSGSDLSGTYWSMCDLSKARMVDAGLRNAFLQGCTLSEAHLDRADLTSARLVSSYATEASFRGAILKRTSTTAAKFTGSDFSAATAFFRSREIVAEVLRQGVGDDWELAALVGAVLLAPTWCYPEWRAWLDAHPRHLAVAQEIFTAYPESGCAEALLGAGMSDDGS